MTATAADFEFVRALARERIGLALPENREYLVDARLAPIVRREGLASVDQLVAMLRSGDEARCAEVVDVLATKETYFFRDVHPFETLRTEIIPPLLKAAGRRGLNIWSAGAATGQEPYSLSILMREYFSLSPGPSILATDFSQDALEIANCGKYSQLEVNRGLPARFLVKYFDQDGHSWIAKDEIRNLVTFQELNLVKPFPALRRMDIVLMRNVITYFDAPTKTSVLAKMTKVLRPGGYLLLGGTESTHGLHDGYEIVKLGKSVCYRNICGVGGSDEADRP